MSQTLASRTFTRSSTLGDRQILCYYINRTPHIQILRLNHHPNFDFEKVVFPSQRLMFRSLPNAQLEISPNDKSAFTIPCDQLRVTEQ
jgi:hypothetical protein